MMEGLQQVSLTLPGCKWSGSMDTVAEKGGELLGFTWCDRLGGEGLLNQEAGKIHPGRSVCIRRNQNKTIMFSSVGVSSSSTGTFVPW